MTTSRRLADRKSAKFQKNITKRGSVPETTVKKGNDYPVGPMVLGFFIFVVIGSFITRCKNPKRKKGEEKGSKLAYSVALGVIHSHGAGSRGAAARRLLQAGRCRTTAPQQVLLLLRRPRLHDLRPHGLQRGGDERGADLHGGGPGRERRADRGALRRHQHLLARRRAAGRVDLRPPGPPPHHRAHQRLLPRRPAHHGARRRLRGAHGRQVRRRHRRRLRARHRPRLRRRDRPRLLPRPPQLPPRDFYQWRSDAELRVQLGLLGVAGAPVVAADVRRRRGAHRLPGGRRAHHAGVAAVAGDEGAARRGEAGARPDVRHAGRGRAAAAGDRGRRRRRRRLRRRRRVEGGGDQGRGAPRAGHRRDAPVLPAGVRHRLRGAVRPASARRRRRDVEHPPPGPQRRVRRRQGELHPHRHGAHRPRRAAPPPARQHGRHDRLPPRAGLRVRGVPGPRQGRRRGGRRGGGRGGGVRLHLLRRHRPAGVGVQLGDPAAAAARAGRRRRHRHEPHHERRRHHDVHLALRRHHHGRRVLPLRGHRRRLLRVHLRLPAGDEGPEPRGHGGALPHQVTNSIHEIHLPYFTGGMHMGCNILNAKFDSFLVII